MDDYFIVIVYDVFNVVFKNKLMVLDERFFFYFLVFEIVDVEDEEYVFVKVYLLCFVVEFWGYKKYYDDEFLFVI